MKTIKLKTVAIVLALTFAGSSMAFADDDPNVHSDNGGVVVTVPDIDVPMPDGLPPDMNPTTDGSSEDTSE